MEHTRIGPSAVPMTAEVREVMRQQIKAYPASEYVFVNPKTGKPYAEIKKGFAEACERAGSATSTGTTCATRSAPGAPSQAAGRRRSRR